MRLFLLILLPFAVLIGAEPQPAATTDAGTKSSGASYGEPADVPPSRHGDWVLVLQSSPTATAEYLTYFQNRASALNDFVRRDHTHRWEPYFGVRKPDSGGIQLVFGEVDGQFGVVREDFPAFTTLLTKSEKDGGTGFPSASWVRVEGPYRAGSP
jgi:hypothetical protein